MPPSDPESELLPYLATFSKAAELCNFTAAARGLGLTQAAISQRIQSLEKAVGVSLFHREGGRVQLTDKGRKLYELAQQILELHRTARRLISGEANPVTGELLLAASSIPGEHLLPELLAQFQPKYPLIQVRATVTDSMAVNHQIERGEAHLGLVGWKEENPHLEYRFLARDHMILVMLPTHPLAKKAQLTVQDLVGHPLIVREAGSGLRHCLEQTLENAGSSLQRFRIAMELGSNEAIKEAVLRGLGVAFLSRSAVARELQAERLIARELHDLQGGRDLFLVRDRRRVLPLPARLFWFFAETTSVSVS